MKYLFDGDYDKLEFIIEEQLDGYDNIELHEDPVTIKETIRDVIQNGAYYRVEQSEEITIGEEEFHLKEMIPIVANQTDYHVIGVSVGSQRDDVKYFVVPCHWTPRFGSPSAPTTGAQ